MDKDILQRYFFIGLLLIVSVFIVIIFLPFFEVIVLSGIFAIALNPIYKIFCKAFGNRKRLSAILVILLFAILVITPFTILTTQVLKESRGLYTEITAGNQLEYLQKLTVAIEKPIQKFYPSFTLDLKEYISLGADFITSHLSSIVSSVLNTLTSIVLIVISIYFLLRDGKKFKKMLVNLSPLGDEYDEQIFDKIRHTINSTIRGVILVAITQGILAGIGMKIFGVPNPALWGSVSAVASLVPGLGTAIVFIPATAFMFFTNNIAYAIGLALWGILIVGLVDNFLTPYLYSRGIEVHQLVMLFAVLGGIAVFGPIGFIFGPIVLALFFSLIEIYQNLILKERS